MKVDLKDKKVKDGNLSMFENLDEALYKNEKTKSLEI